MLKNRIFNKIQTKTTITHKFRSHLIPCRQTYRELVAKWKSQKSYTLIYKHFNSNIYSKRKVKGFSMHGEITLNIDDKNIVLQY